MTFYAHGVLARRAALLAATAALVGCTAAQVQQAETVLIDAIACQADLKGIKGLTVASALRVATTPSCIEALNAAVAAGQSASVVAFK